MTTKAEVMRGLFIIFVALGTVTANMTSQEKRELKLEAEDMFYHAYDAYMFNAFPADELMPLTCQGRIRGVQPNRGDIDDALGNFSLTLIDSLDSLVILNNLDEFERAVDLVINNVQFDSDVSVSVFETNIRVVGGLISAHLLADLVKNKYPGERMDWYKDQLLDLALDMGYRLLPAFNTSTGLPHPRVNLKYGLKSGKVKPLVGETCTACAGTMILEFAALSRLTGEPVFEDKASRAMDVIWQQRHRMSNLVGNVLNIQTGDWVRRDSGVGAGIDSYYEYVAKAYVLLGDDKYLNRWQTHYSAIMKYLGVRPLLQDVHMHRPTASAKHFIDALGAFWPGLQVMMGDLEPAIESHEILYQIMQRHHFIPEAFTADFQVHWGQHLLRPEFVESTYFLYRATEDPYYLEVGKKVLKSLQKHARVTCGYATIKDVRTMVKEDRMDSFVLAETFKYLYLLFAEERDLIVDLDDFVFTTEAHLLPLSLARLSNMTAVPWRGKNNSHNDVDEDVDFARSCPSPEYFFPSSKSNNNNNNNPDLDSSVVIDDNSSNVIKFARKVRSPLANVVRDKCPARKAEFKRKLYASEFQTGNPQHLQMVKDMGISIISLPDGRVQLLHTLANAKSPEDGEEGLMFMQEMVELSKQTGDAGQETPPKLVSFDNEHLFAGPAQFGRQLEKGFRVQGQIILSDPISACQVPIKNGGLLFGKVVVIRRGECMFVEKARTLQAMGALGGIVLDNSEDSSSRESPLFAMSGDGNDDVSIPMVFLFKKEGERLLKKIRENPELRVTLQEATDEILAAQHAALLEEEESLSLPSAFDFTSPVKKFLEQSRQKMQSYFTSFTSNSNDEKKETTDSINIYTAEDGTSYATTFKTVVGPDGQKSQKIVQVQAFTQLNDGTVSVRALTDQEAAKIISDQKKKLQSTDDDDDDDDDLVPDDEDDDEDEEEEVAVIPQVINTVDEEDQNLPELPDSFIDSDNFMNYVLDLLPNKRTMLNPFRGKNYSFYLENTDDRQILALMLQSSWENRHKFPVKDMFELAVELVYSLSTEEATSHVSDKVTAFIKESVESVQDQFPDAVRDYRDILGDLDDDDGENGEFLRRVHKFFDTKTKDFESEAERNRLRDKLLVHPVILESLAEFRSNLRIRRDADKLVNNNNNIHDKDEL